VILMGITHRRIVASQLIEGGLDSTTPIAVVESAWTPEQRVVRGSLGELGDLDVSSPAVIVVGEAAALDVTEIGSLASLAQA
jgi:siroheme synthase